MKGRSFFGLMTRFVFLDTDFLPILAGSKFNMAIFSKLIKISLSTLCLLNCTNLFSLKPASAEGIYLDKNCSLNQRLPKNEKFLVFYKSEFRANSQNYLLSAARYQDGAAILCISKPDFKQASIVKDFPASFISTIAKDTDSKGEFIVTVREGNGRNVPITVYQIDVTDPNRPKVIKQNTTLRSLS